jgi:hypothetical protein
LLRIGFVVLSAAVLRAETNQPAAVAVAPAPAVSNDYVWLTSDALPQPGVMIDAAMAALPKTLAEKTDWVARMRKAVWIPNIGVKYDIGQTGFRRYQYISNRRVTSTGSQSTRESSSQSGQNTTQSGELGNVQVYGQGTDPLSTLGEIQNSTKGGAQIENTGSAGSRDSVSSSSSVQDYGPDSVALNDVDHWVSQYGIVLSWDLSRLIFRQEEVAVVQAEIDKEQFRQNVRQQVIQTYYDLKESILLLQNEAYKDSVPVRIRKERLAYLLDTITGGALSERSGHKAF